jgi:hypothetical protein
MNMKTKLFALLSAIAVSCLALILSNTAAGQESSSKSHTGGTASSTSAQPPGSKASGGAVVATPIRPEEAAKKYPPPNGKKYPVGERDPHKAPGIVNSPYPPRVEFDCSQIPSGGLVLDTRVNQVFVRP